MSNEHAAPSPADRASEAAQTDSAPIDRAPAPTQAAAGASVPAAREADGAVYTRAAGWHLGRASRAGHWLDTTIPERAVEEARDHDDHFLRATRLALSVVLAMAALGIVAAILGLIDLLEEGDEPLELAGVFVALAYGVLFCLGVRMAWKREGIAARRSALRIFAFLGGVPVVMISVSSVGGIINAGMFSWGGLLEVHAVGVVVGFIGALVAVGMMAASGHNRWRVFAVVFGAMFLAGAWIDAGGSSIALAILHTEGGATTPTLTIWGLFVIVAGLLPAQRGRIAARFAIRAWWLMAMLVIVVGPTLYFVDAVAEGNVYYSRSYDVEYVYAYVDDGPHYELNLNEILTALGFTIGGLAVGLIPMVTMVAWPALMTRFGWRRRWRREMRHDVVKSGAGTLEHALLELDMRRERGEIDEAAFAAESARLLEGAASPEDKERASRVRQVKSMSIAGPSEAEEREHLDRLPPGAVAWLGQLHASYARFIKATAILACVGAFGWVVAAASGITSGVAGQSFVAGAGVLILIGLFLTFGRLPSTRRSVTVVLTTIAGIALWISWIALRAGITYEEATDAASVLQCLWLIVLFIAGRSIGGASSRAQSWLLVGVCGLIAVASGLSFVTAKEDSEFAMVLTIISPVAALACGMALVGVVSGARQKVMSVAIVVLFVIQGFGQDLLLVLGAEGTYTWRNPGVQASVALGAAGVLSMAMALAWGLQSAIAHWRRSMLAYPPPIGMSDAREYDLIATRYQQHPERFAGVAPEIEGANRGAAAIDAALRELAARRPPLSRRRKLQLVGGTVGIMLLVAAAAFGLPTLHQQQLDAEYDALVSQLPPEARDRDALTARLSYLPDEENALVPLRAVGRQLAEDWYVHADVWDEAERADGPFYTALAQHQSFPDAVAWIAEAETDLVHALRLAKRRDHGRVSQPMDAVRYDDYDYNNYYDPKDVDIAFTAYGMHIDLMLLDGRVDDAFAAWVNVYSLVSNCTRSDPSAQALAFECSVRTELLEQLERMIRAMLPERVLPHVDTIEPVLKSVPMAVTDARLSLIYDAWLVRGLERNQDAIEHATRMAYVRDALVHRPALRLDNPQLVATLSTNTLPGRRWRWRTSPGQSVVNALESAWEVFATEQAALWMIEWLRTSNGVGAIDMDGSARPTANTTLSWWVDPDGESAIDGTATHAGTPDSFVASGLWTYALPRADSIPQTRPR